MKKVGTLHGVGVYGSPYVPKNEIYLINTDQLGVWKIKSFRPTLRTRIKLLHRKIAKLIKKASGIDNE